MKGHILCMNNQKLEQFIMNLRKSDIAYNALMFGEKISMSWNKEKMSKRLAEIYIKNIEEFLALLSLHVLLFVKHIHQKKLNGKIHAYLDEESFLVNELCEQLEFWGLISYNAGMITIPDVLLDLVNCKIDKMRMQIVEWEEIEYCTQGIIYTYGLLEEKFLLSNLSACFPNISCEDLKKLILRRTRLRVSTVRISIGEDVWWFDNIINDCSRWYRVIQDRKDIPYRIYTKSEYMQAALGGLPKTPKNMDALVEILKKYGMSEEQAENCLMDTAIEHCQNLNIAHALPEFLCDIDWDSKDNLQHFLNLFMEFQNDTPLWYNKGNTPEEIFVGRRDGNTIEKSKNLVSNVVFFPKSPKIGRNEPCPCGSGKKYKNCCGRNDEE